MISFSNIINLREKGINSIIQLDDLIKKSADDKQFSEEYYSELSVYKIAAKEILENYKKLPNTKQILIKLDKLQEKRIPLCKSIL